MLFFKDYVFSEKGDQTPIKRDGTGNPAPRTASRLLTDDLAS